MVNWKELDWETFEENIKPPTLRYEGGDVVIALSKSPDDVLLLHSSVLRASSWFGARLSGRWKTKNNIDGTSFEDRKRSEVWTYGLVFPRCQAVDGMYCRPDAAFLLHGEALPSWDNLCNRPGWRQPVSHMVDIPDGRLGHFYHTDGPDFPRRVYHTEDFNPDADAQREPFWIHVSWAQSYAIRDHKILFALLYDLVVDWSKATIGEAVNSLANVTMYATYYDLLPFLAPRIANALKSLPDIWKDVARNSGFHIILSREIRDASLYLDAIRHYVGLHSVWDIFGIAGDETFQLLTHCVRAGIDKLVHDINSELFNLALSPLTIYHGKGSRRHHVTNFRGLFLFRFREKKTEDDKALFLARSVFREYLDLNMANINNHYRDRHYCCPSVQYHYLAQPAGTSNELYRRLIKAANNRDISIFGKDAPNRLKGMFNLPSTSRKVIESELHRLLGEAKRTIEQAVMHQQRHAAFWEEDLPSRSYFNNVKMDCKDVPWAEEDEWKAEGPNLDGKTEKVSDEWATLVGLDKWKNAQADIE